MRKEGLIITPQAVGRIAQSVRIRGNALRKPWSGRPRCTTLREERHIISLTLRSPKITRASLKTVAGSIIKQSIFFSFWNKRQLYNYHSRATVIIIWTGMNFVQDGAPAHVTQSNKEFQMSPGGSIQLPPKSPDINIIESWVYLRKTVALYRTSRQNRLAAIERFGC